MEALVIRTMTHIEAKECVARINSGIKDVRKLILDLYERNGWEALGYTSWRACVTAEFGEKERYLYNQLDAAKVERNICTMAQSIEPKQSPIPERHLRPLSRLPPEQQAEAWEKAVDTAPEGKVTAAHVEKVVEEILPVKRELPTDAILFATMAISQLERIRKDDPKREEALTRVETWINKNRKQRRD